MNSNELPQIPDRGAISSAMRGRHRHHRAGATAGRATAAAAADAAIANPLAPKQAALPAKAKNVIFMFMEGGPSQIDLFDPKPELQKWNGKPLPESHDQGSAARLHQAERGGAGEPAQFQPVTASAAWSSPITCRTWRTCADDICLVRSMHTDAFNHHPGQLLLFSGSMQVGRPTMGAWVLYGLGSESQNLPGFVVLSSGVGHQRRRIELVERLSAVDLLRARMFRSSGDPILYLSNPPGVTRERAARASRCAARSEPGASWSRPAIVEIASRISSYELAFRMQMAGAGAARFLEGIAGDARDVRREQGADQAIRDQLPAGAPHGGARRALRDADARQLGRSHRI